MYFKKSYVDEVIEREKKEQENLKKEQENLKLACKEIFSNQNAFYFLKYLKTISLWDEEDNNVNNDILAYKKGRRDIWLIIRKILPKEIRVKVEDTE